MRQTQIAMPGLQIDEINKENMPTLSPISKKNRKRKRSKANKSLLEPVPPLQLLTGNHDGDFEEEEVVEESGDVIITNSNTETIEPPPEMIPIVDHNSHTTNISLSQSGRLLESDTDWSKRAKVTYVGTEMNFRPLRMKCTHCEEAYTKTHDLYAHIRSHQHHTKCPHCGKILTCMATFVYHVRTHTAEKPYYCPVDKCDFTNAVKYNLKVHLACIRHGGKENLAKFAKVLDLDVCEKSLKKRKDNSVHELGSRRCKKRRKLNNISQSINENAPMQSNMNSFYPKQEEYEFDQVAASLLYHFPLVFDSNMNNAMNAHSQSLVDWNSIMPNQNVSNYKLENNIIKSEKQMQNNINSEMNNSSADRLKLEQYYEPLYGYYPYNNSNNVTNQTSPSASTIWDNHKLESQMNTQTHSITPNNNNNNYEQNSENAIITKQEPIFNEYNMHASHPSYMSGMAPPMLAPHSQNMYYPNMNPYYMNMNYDTSAHGNAQMNHNILYNNDRNINNKVDVPPLPDLFPDNDD